MSILVNHLKVNMTITAVVCLYKPNKNDTKYCNALTQYFLQQVDFSYVQMYTVSDTTWIVGLYSSYAIREAEN